MKRVVLCFVALLLMSPYFIVVAYCTTSTSKIFTPTVTAFCGGTLSTSSSTTFSTTSVSPGSIVSAGGNIANRYGGFYFQLPSSSFSGYLIVAGLQLITSVRSSNGWGAPTKYQFINMYYYISTEPPSSHGVDLADGEGAPFSGIVEVPAVMDTNLYLVVYGDTGTGSSSNRTIGVSYSSSSVFRYVSSSYTSLTSVTTILNNILNELRSSSSQDASSAAFIEQVEGIMQQIDDLVDRINENTNRPPIESLLPSPPGELLQPSDPVSMLGYSTVSSILETPFLLTVLFMVITLAFLRYVLFGKVQ